MDARQHPVDADVTAAYLDNLTSLERYARSLTRDEDAAADLCQDVFIRLLVIARAGRMPDVPAAWMRRVAHNVFVSNARRKNTHERTIEALGESRHVASTEDTAIGREREAMVHEVLTGVRPFEREAMVLAAEG
ncbi:MAG TPA: sigma-70 family RNA polymerase sigma factor, partial [Candidatus Limnocylindrales bacterium]|nr:sigma-70 family RNA polymerase sigma factor [Candidatus Limnocylindrales bacterium]